MKPEDVLGRPLADALRLAEEAGVSPRVVRTGDPRGGRSEGTPRVVRVRGDEWTVALFRDGMPRRSS